MKTGIVIFFLCFFAKANAQNTTVPDSLPEHKNNLAVVNNSRLDSNAKICICCKPRKPSERPMYMVNGKKLKNPEKDMSRVDLKNVDSIKIYNTTEAKKIYGVNAPNGLLTITTKKIKKKV